MSDPVKAGSGSTNTRKELIEGNRAWQLDSYQDRGKLEAWWIPLEEKDWSPSYFSIYKSCLVRTRDKGLRL